jgi:hypothetical protein
MARSFKTHNFIDWYEITRYIGEGLSICEFDLKESVFSDQAFSLLILAVISGVDFKIITGLRTLPSRAEDKIHKLKKINVKYLDGIVRIIENETDKSTKPPKTKCSGKKSDKRR